MVIYLLKSGSKNIVIFATLGFLGIGLYGSYHMEQPNDPQKMLPTDSYLSAWIEIQMSHFPSYGYYASVMTGPLDWTDLAKIEKMVHQLEEVAQPGPGRIINNIESWWPHFVKFLQEKMNMSWADIRDNEQFHKYLGDFLFDVDNAKHRAFFKFLNNLQCGEPAPPILATQQKLYFGMSSSNPPPSEYIPAKNTLDYIVASSNLSTTAFVHAAIYRAWESDAIISVEMWRNLGMALGAVGIVSLVMLGDIRLCVMVMACVMFTLVDLIGTLYFWDVNIDIISCVNVILATGLSVDYCVHIANAFSISKGCPTSRTQAALTSLGSAVFNGGLTTLLAVIVLPGSKSHFFLTFFKVFCLTVLYGLFHGLVLLPVLLTNLGNEYEEDASIQTRNVVIKEKVKEMLKEEKERRVMLEEKVKAMKKF